jgi:hypothetical protein
MDALTLFNSEIVFGWSQALAGRVMRETGNDDSAQLDRLYQILFARNPDATEKATLLGFLASHEKVVKEKAADGKLAIAIPVGLKDTDTLNPIKAAAFVDLVRVVVNSNEFSYRFFNGFKKGKSHEQAIAPGMDLQRGLRSRRTDTDR